MRYVPVVFLYLIVKLRIVGLIWILFFSESTQIVVVLMGNPFGIALSYPNRKPIIVFLTKLCYHTAMNKFMYNDFISTVQV